VVSDNGFGSKGNSADAMLAVHRVRPDWNSGAVQIERSVFLSDPNRQVPFLIVNEGTRERYLTGADFDTESLQVVGDTLWFGDEFGPWLISTDLQGRVTGVHATQVDGKPVRSPDHAALGMPAIPSAVTFEARRSRGFEGMAASRDGRLLHPLLEGPLWTGSGWEMHDGCEVLRILVLGADGIAAKVGSIDLMAIADSQNLARRGGKDGRFTFPFVTIEDVDVVDAEHIIVANDNNYPYSMGRALGRQDDNEFILLRVPELLKAR
jgi:hypothetical protein